MFWDVSLKKDMPALMQNLGYVVAFTCLLFALHLLRTCLKPSSHRLAASLLCSLFFVFFLQYGFLSLVLASGRLGALAGFPAQMRPVLALLIGPLILLYFTSAKNWTFKLNIRHGLYFIPALLIGAQMFSDKYFINVDFVIIALFTGYALFFLKMARQGSSQFTHLGTGKNGHFRALIASALMLLLAACVESLIILDIAQGRGLTGSVSLLFTLLLDLALVTIVLGAALQRSSPFDWLYAPKPQPPSETEISITKKFTALVKKDRLHTQENLSLKTISQRLNIPARHLSEAINKCHGEGYSAYMNGVRVKAAKKLISSDRNITMTNVMYDCGFYSKSSFNKEFRARENMSPSDYRAQLQKGAS